MTSLFFVVPARGRLALTEVCLRQLRRTCDELSEKGIQASAVVIADDENLEVAHSLGFGTVERDNDFLGAKFNDGFEAAGREGVDYAVALGSDDWVDATWVAAFLPPPDVVRCSRLMSMVDETGETLSELKVGYEGGHGIRVYPRALLERARLRPAEEFRRRAVDTSTLTNLKRVSGGALRVSYFDTDALAVVDWKSPREQLNPSESCARYATGGPSDPFEVLAGRFPDEALGEMRDVYVREAVAV